MTDEAARIAGSLTKAQRTYLSDKAEWRKPKVWAQARWMTFPPPNTHRVLIAKGLIDRHGILSETGLAVRTHLGDSHDRD